MITYELAKQLKDAGFPQKERSILVGNEDSFIPDATRLDEYLYVPFLSELIEACGERFCCLKRSQGQSRFTWLAESSGDKRKAWLGGTPEEAVACLFLALNSKSSPDTSKR